MSRKVLPRCPAALARQRAARRAAHVLPGAAHTLGSAAPGLCLLVLPAPSPSREGQQQRQPRQQPSKHQHDKEQPVKSTRRYTAAELRRTMKPNATFLACVIQGLKAMAEAEDVAMGAARSADAQPGGPTGATHHPLGQDHHPEGLIS